MALTCVYSREAHDSSHQATDFFAHYAYELTAPICLAFCIEYVVGGSVPPRSGFGPTVKELSGTGVKNAHITAGEAEPVRSKEPIYAYFSA